MIIIFQVILGRSGTGKTVCLRKFLQETLLRKNAQNEKKKIIYLVPEQNSFETEKGLLNLLGERDFKFVNVLTFERMSDFIFREVGGVFSSKLSDGIKNIIMSLAIEKSEPDLMLYKKSSDDIEMVQMMVDTLKDMNSCTISCEYMEKCHENLREGTLKQKLQETVTIMKNYLKLMEENFSDPTDDLTLLFEALKNTKIFEGYILFVDSFDSFTILQMKILEEIMIQSKDFFITFCTDRDFKSEIGITCPVSRFVNKLMNIAERNSLKISQLIVLEDNKRFKNADLRILEKNLFASPKEVYLSEPQHIFLYNASDVYDECEFVARTIRKMVIEKGFRYKDFALATRNLEEYFEKIENIFVKYEIPYFMNSPQKTENKALFCAVFSAFEAVVSNFESGDIFRYLKTGLVGFTVDEISLLENYVFLWEISGDRWKMPFDMHPSGFSKEMSDTEQEKLEKIEETRKGVIEPLLKFQKGVFGKTGDEISRAVYEFLEDIEMRKNIRKFCTELIDAKDLTNAEQQSRIWDMLMVALDRTAEALKGIKTKPKRYMELLRIAVQSDDISFIPEGMDEVVISSVNDRKISECKAVFVVGAVEGEFPKTPVSSGIFSNSEKKEISDLGIKMYDNFEEMYETERFVSYLALFSASEYLFVSWPSSGLMGGVKFSSEIVKEIKCIFPKIKISDKHSFPLEDWLWSEKSAFDVCAKNFNEKNLLSLSLKDYFFKQEPYKHKIKAISRASQKKELKILDSDLAEKLFGKNIKVSASQIEKFYSCRFQYFCQYGLKAKERKKARFNSLEYGNLIHFVLERVFKLYPEGKISELSEDSFKISVDDILKEYINDYLGGIEEKSPRFKYLFSRCKNAISILLKRLTEEFKQSLFKPADCELKIAEDGELSPLVLSLPDGGEIIVEGKVDRVDVMETNGKSYIRIVDYKTGHKKFKLSDVLYGLNMQMLLYLLTIEKNGEKRYGNIIPAGILYMPAIRPMITAENGDSDSSLNDKIRKKFRMNGLILNNVEVIRGMEHDAKGIFIPALVKNGNLSGEESLASLEEIGLIAQYIEKMAIEMGKSLHEGEINFNPIKDSEKKTCDWCPYGSVCGFEDEECERNLAEMKKEKVMEEIQGKVKGEHNG